MKKKCKLLNGEYVAELSRPAFNVIVTRNATHGCALRVGTDDIDIGIYGNAVPPVYVVSHTDIALFEQWLAKWDTAVAVCNEQMPMVKMHDCDRFVRQIELAEQCLLEVTEPLYTQPSVYLCIEDVYSALDQVKNWDYICGRVHMPEPCRLAGQYVVSFALAAIEEAGLPVSFALNRYPALASVTRLRVVRTTRTQLRIHVTDDMFRAHFDSEGWTNETKRLVGMQLNIDIAGTFREFLDTCSVIPPI